MAIAVDDTFDTSEDGELQLGAALPETTEQEDKSTFNMFENGALLAE